MIILTIKAKILALEQTAKKMYSIRRLLDQLRYGLDQPFQIFYNNITMIDKVTHPNGHISTKLQHMNIQNIWLQQEYDHGKFIIKYLATNKMPTNGFTKLLTHGQFKQFIKQLKMTIHP